MVTLMSFDVEGASARSFSLAPPARCLFQSPPPFRATDEGAVGAVLDANDIRREDEKREQWETMNVDAQEAVLGLLFMGSAHNPRPFPPGRAPEVVPTSAPPPA